jgi:hypothetical protein
LALVALATAPSVPVRAVETFSEALALLLAVPAAVVVVATDWLAVAVSSTTPLDTGDVLTTSPTVEAFSTTPNAASVSGLVVRSADAESVIGKGTAALVVATN